MSIPREREFAKSAGTMHNPEQGLGFYVPKLQNALTGSYSENISVIRKFDRGDGVVSGHDVVVPKVSQILRVSIFMQGNLIPCKPSSWFTLVENDKIHHTVIHNVMVGPWPQATNRFRA